MQLLETDAEKNELIAGHFMELCKMYKSLRVYEGEK